VSAGTAFNIAVIYGCYNGCSRLTGSFVMEDTEYLLQAGSFSESPEAMSAIDREALVDLIRDEWDQDCYWSL
jgi:hypothetical protein